MKRSGPLKRKAPLRRKAGLKPGGPIRRKKRLNPINRERRAAEFARAYGSEARVEWVRRQPCAVCACVPSENAHTETGGVGRKADAATVAPLCSDCHRELHDTGRRTFELLHDIDLARAAELTEARWQAYSA